MSKRSLFFSARKDGVLARVHSTKSYGATLFAAAWSPNNTYENLFLHNVLLDKLVLGFAHECVHHDEVG